MELKVHDHTMDANPTPLPTRAVRGAALPFEAGVPLENMVPLDEPVVITPIELPPISEGVEEAAVAAFNQSMAIPPEYVELNLSSNGRLGLPSTIHVRDYTGEDALHLASAKFDNVLETLLRIVKGMILEDVDVLDLHENDLLEIMLNIHIAFWSPVMENYFFPLQDSDFEGMSEERKRRILEGKESATIDVDLRRLKTVVLPEGIKEPITITRGNITVQFIFPRVGHSVFAERFVNEQYKFEEEKFAQIAAHLRLVEAGEADANELDSTAKAEFYDYMKSKEGLMAAVLQAQLLYSYNGCVLNTLEEKLEAYKKLGVQFWGKYNAFIESCKFGVDDELEIISPITNLPVTRRCPFQYMDFVPTNTLSRVDDFAISFG